MRPIARRLGKPLGRAAEISGNQGRSPRRRGCAEMTSDCGAWPNERAASAVNPAAKAEPVARGATAPSAVTPSSAGALVGGCSETAALFRLMAWLSPAYPVGAFSYSSGLEWAVEAGDVTTASALTQWLATLLSDGAGFCDAMLFAHAYRACATGNDDALCEVAELAAALAPSRERFL